ncbi:hypothetical protein DL96DRAFT_1760250 [Flagelloscypha sp. PMI_526]|nr:hypothetical protein DL96DRAFT_1760250 [Flagelloscypha sp. PMI_526]
MKLFFLLAATSAFAASVQPIARNVEAKDLTAQSSPGTHFTDLSVNLRPPLTIIPVSRTLPPNGHTECYTEGTAWKTSDVLASTSQFCDAHMGQYVASGVEIWGRYLISQSTTGNVYLSAKANDGCNWTIASDCNEILQNIAKVCLQPGFALTWGGRWIDGCGTWRLDVGLNGSDY